MRNAVLMLLVLSGTVWAAPDLNESYNSLKTAVEKQDYSDTKTLAEALAAEAKKASAEAQPPEADQVEAWKARQQFAKDAAEYGEYSLAIATLGNPEKAAEYGDALIALNPKSSHIDTITTTYLAALNKQGAAKASAGAQKIIVGRPDNEDALYALASSNSSYAGRLIQVMNTKAKPENVGEADWQKKKSVMLGNAMYIQGTAACGRQAWTDCDRALKGAQPYLSGGTLGTALFYLGLANFQMGSVTQDKSKQQAGLAYSKQAAGIAGPMQGQASNNVALMTKQLGTPVRR